MADASLLLAVERHPRVEDPLVERDQPIHVGGEERHVMQVVDQGHTHLPRPEDAHSTICSALIGSDVMRTP